MSEPEVTIKAKTEYDPSGLQEMKRDVETAKNKVTESTGEMEKGYFKLAGQMSHVITAGLSLESTWDRVAKGQMSVFEGVLRTIPALVSLTKSIWDVVTAEKARKVAHFLADAAASGITKIGATIASVLAKIATSSWAVTIAEKARAVAHFIANAIATGGLAIPALIAAGAAATVAAIALTANIPSRQFGGPIERTGPYLLHAGEFVVPKGGSPITIIINEARTPRETGDAVVYSLRRAGVV